MRGLLWRWAKRFGVLITGGIFGLTGVGQGAGATLPVSATNFIVFVQGTVEYLPTGSAKWLLARQGLILRPGDQVRTGERSGTEIYLGSGLTIRKGEMAQLEIPPSQGVTFQRGLFYIFHRERRRKVGYSLPGATAAVRGTEFVVKVFDDNRSELTVLDGAVELSTPDGAVALLSNEQVTFAPGQAPRKTSVVQAMHSIIQWCLYYPSVLDLEELQFSEEASQALANSLGAYRSGNMVAAVASYPWDRASSSDAERSYRAALLLSVGQVQAAESLVTSLPTPTGTGRALQRLMAAIAAKPSPADIPLDSASEWLAESYRQQASLDLDSALAAARKAVKLSPDFGFAWTRMAELEFSFGRTAKAREALEKGQRISPTNAAAFVLRGFLRSAQNQVAEASDCFERAIQIDGTQANAWLGHGLCHIRAGRLEVGLRDLTIAASLEPQRSQLRSYLGKAFGEAGSIAKALNELDLAQRLDPHDPTSWLYSALLKHLNNRVNEAVVDLQESQRLTSNRSLFRSQFLLDQDRAVRSANLAAIYRDSGMFEVGVNEASRALDRDYANYSAHLFLANSYNLLRDPRQANLRYETATFSEYLLANLLSPAGAGTLSPTISAEEYSKLFERDRLGLISTSSYASSGDWATSATQFGTWRDFGYAVEGSYSSLTGSRPNTDYESKLFSGLFKANLGVQDTVYVEVIDTRVDSGDTRQYYDPADSSPTLRISERQEPNLFLGYHHEWQPGMHTLLLVGRLTDVLQLSEPNAQLQTFLTSTNGMTVGTTDRACALAGTPDCHVFGLDYESDFEAYTVELQQIYQSPRQTWVVGLRFQTGDTVTESVLYRDHWLFPPDSYPAELLQHNETDLRRAGGYGYYTLRIAEPVSLTAGMAYDALVYPENIDAPPISDRELEADQFSPKLGLRWQPADWLALRGAYSWSLGGLYQESSVRLEPTQVAGLNQAYRSLIPESVSGPLAGAKLESAGVGADGVVAGGTFFGVAAEWLRSDAERVRGVYDLELKPPYVAAPTGVLDRLDYEEQSVALYLNHLAGRYWSFGAHYLFSRASLDSSTPRSEGLGIPDAKSDRSAVLNQLRLDATFRHPRGFFLQWGALWTTQSNEGYSPDLLGDDFWQFDVVGGFVFPRRRAQLSLGLLNLTDCDYRLNPLNLIATLPRERTFFAGLALSF